MSLRDIDPSWVLPKTKQTSSWSGFEPTWWAPAQVQWDPLLSDREWIRNSADLPAVEPLIAVIDPHDSSHWLTLKGSYRWGMSMMVIIATHHTLKELSNIPSKVISLSNQTLLSCLSG